MAKIGEAIAALRDKQATDSAVLAAVKTELDEIKAGGGSGVDLAPVLAAIAATQTSTQEAIAALSAKVDALENSVPDVTPIP